MHDRPPNTPMTDADPLCRLSVEVLTTEFRTGRLSPVDVTTAALDRAEAINPVCNAFARIDREGALASALSSERRWRQGAPAGAIDGVPVTVKDMIWIKDWSIRYGSLNTEDMACAADAPAVARLRAAGAPIIGTTTTPEFGWKALSDSPLSGTTRNPWNVTLTAGGSSGGAAVAAATGAGVLHLGTDGGGSIRIPSAFVGIVGLKPTYGRVPAYPMSAFGTVAHLGPMTRRVADGLAMLSAMAGRDEADWLQGPALLPALATDRRGFEGARIGFWREPSCGHVEADIATIVDGTVRALGRLGAAVEIVELPGTDLLATLDILWSAGAAARVSGLDATARARLDAGLLRLAEAGETLSAVPYVRAMTARVEFGRRMDALAARYDIIVSPSTAVAAFPVGHDVPPCSGYERWTEWAGFSYPINLSQQPACSVPCGATADGRPVGLQFIGPRGADTTVLAYAAAFEAAFSDFFL